ncbi:Aromatic prenyltransferase DMATS type [Penicillium coprophilum]|uniref:Aromatic prenyltransferase DMATS type n=1 Tax=Penicillium coprophilum TaxID=36646 RepID=UPI0023A2E842|nr:Aromatic prenyltransferase DMATS type [Penicillium coprophilum]KAJ5165584.1 Aromatic prenyltransferase DMATS type [Penicillium coprophilum]
MTVSSVEAPKASVPAVTQPADMPHRTLSRSMTFANLDQYQYWHAVGPMLGRMLSNGNYSIHQQYEYLCLFAHVIIPKLGPFPGGRDIYKCLLGGTGSVELSQNVQKLGLTARVAFEPTSYIASTGVDPLNRHTVHATLAELRAIGSATVDMELHQMLVNELTLTDREEKLMSPEQISGTAWKTQILLALDLGQTGITVKEYLYPALKASVIGKTVAELCFSAIRKVDTQGVFEASTQAIETYMQTQSQTDLYFLSCDLVDPARTRIKLYLMELDMRMEKVEEHWTMGGKLIDEETVLGLKMLRELWVEFGIIEGMRNEPERPSLPGDPDTIVPFIMNYEMNPCEALPKPKFYFPLVGISELKIANVLTAFFERYDMPEQAAVYRDNLQTYYPSKDLAVATDHQAWMSFSYTKKKGPYLTMYYH